MAAAAETRIGYWIVFFGSVWGLTEATLGHLLHILPLPGAAGDMMFPVACLCMTAAWKRTGRLRVIPAVGMIAMLIKAVDLLLPGTPPAMVVNPMLAIMAESLVLLAGCRWLKISFERMPAESALILATTWRLGYLLIAALAARFFDLPNFTVEGPGSGFSFILIHGLSGAFLLLFSFGSVSRLGRRLESFRLRLLPVSPPLLFCLALASEIIF